MALYRLSVQVVGRQHKNHTGRTNSAVGAAAYRAGETLRDTKADAVHNYSGRKGVDRSFIEAPEDAPAWVFDREALWNAVETAEKRKDAQLYREVQLGLQRELPLNQQAEMVREFVQEHFVSKGMIADVAIHQDPENNNPHAHVMLTMRNLEPDGFGLKNRDWNEFNVLKGQKAIAEKGRAAGGGDMVTPLREAWANKVNEALEEGGFAERITHLSNEEARKNRVAENISPAAAAMEERGEETIQGDNLAMSKAQNNAREHQAAFEHEKATIFQIFSPEEFMARLSSWWDGFSTKATDFGSSIRDGWASFVGKNNKDTGSNDPSMEI